MSDFIIETLLKKAEAARSLSTDYSAEAAMYETQGDALAASSARELAASFKIESEKAQHAAYWLKTHQELLKGAENE